MKNKPASQSSHTWRLFLSSMQMFLVMCMVLFMSCQNKTTESNETTEAKEEKQAMVDTTLAEMTLRVKGMTCEGCENTIKSGLKELPGVALVEATHKDSMAVIHYKENQVTYKQIKAKIEEKGYQAGEILNTTGAK